MMMRVQVVFETNDHSPVVVREVFAVGRGPSATDTLGLQLGEAKDLLAALRCKTP